MEKINALIQQLCQLHASDATLESILPVVQQLNRAVEEEANLERNAYSTKGSVSVWMPAARVVANDGGGREMPEPFPQPNPEPFPQPNPEPFPQPTPPDTNPEPVPEPTPQPQEPTILPPAEPATPTRLSFGVPRPPQQIFVENAEPPLVDLRPSTAAEDASNEAAVATSHIEAPEAKTSIGDTIAETGLTAGNTALETLPALEPVAIQAASASITETKPVHTPEMISAAEPAKNAVPAELLSDLFVPPVIDWKLMDQAAKQISNPAHHTPLPEHQAWAGMEAEKEKQEATVVSRRVTPKELAIDEKTLTDIDELIKGKKQALPAKSTELSELNDRLAERTRVLNESFTQHHEMAEMFNGPRITDLRKAISINEKYQYVNNLFRGDEDMFERSVKTINNFRIMPEADYWVQRELIIKLGWNPDDELAQRFYSLVKRRFS